MARRSDSYSSTRGLAQPVFSRSFIPLMTESPHSTRIGPGRFLASPRCSDAGAFSRLPPNSSEPLSRAGAQPFNPLLACTRSSKPPAAAPRSVPFGAAAQLQRCSHLTPSSLWSVTQSGWRPQSEINLTGEAIVSDPPVSPHCIEMLISPGLVRSYSIFGLAFGR